MISDIKAFDIALTTFLSGILPHTPLLNAFFSFLSFQGITLFIWMLVLSAVIVFEELRHRQFFLYFSASVVSSFIMTYLFKFIFQRARPTPLIESILHVCPSDFSFPSGHTATAFTAAFMLSFFDPKRRFLYIFFAILISFSRIYLQCHFILDIFGGIGVAWLVSTLFQKIYLRVFTDFSKRIKM